MVGVKEIMEEKTSKGRIYRVGPPSEAKERLYEKGFIA